MTFTKNDFSGQVAVISGGLGDIGRAVGLKLAAAGADIAIADIFEAERANDYLAQISSLGRNVHYAQVDICNLRAVEEWIATVESVLGVPSLVICNAAIVLLGNSLSVAPDDWSRLMRVNLDGAFYLARTAAANLIQHSAAGRIVFIGSWAASVPHPQIVAYSVAKAGLRMLCKCMALDLAKHNILVNEVAPGYVDGGLARLWYVDHPEERDTDAALVPANRLADPEEVADQVVHLCHPMNRHMTGSVLLMDGGLSLVSPARPDTE